MRFHQWGTSLVRKPPLLAQNADFAHIIMIQFSSMGISLFKDLIGCRTDAFIGNIEAQQSEVCERGFL